MTIEEMAEKYKKQLEYGRAYMKKRYSENPEPMKKYQKEYAKRTGYKSAKKWLANHPEVRLFNSAKQVAKKYGLEFTIAKDDIKIPVICPHTNITLTNIQGQGRVFTNMALSRKDLTKGYTPDNIEVVSNLASMLKNKSWLIKKQILKDQFMEARHDTCPTEDSNHEVQTI